MKHMLSRTYWLRLVLIAVIVCVVGSFLGYFIGGHRAAEQSAGSVTAKHTPALYSRNRASSDSRGSSFGGRKTTVGEVGLKGKENVDLLFESQMDSWLEQEYQDTELIEKWLRKKGLTAVFQWLEKQSLEADRRESLERSIILSALSGHSNLRPRHDANWLMEHSTDENRNQRLEWIIDGWASQHPRALGAWLSRYQRQYGVVDDEIFLTYIKRVLSREPDWAACFVDDITDPEKRELALKYIAEQRK